MKKTVRVRIKKGLSMPLPASVKLAPGASRYTMSDEETLDLASCSFVSRRIRAGDLIREADSPAPRPNMSSEELPIKKSHFTGDDNK